VPAAPIPDDVAVRVEGLSKAFRLPHEQVHTLKERALHPMRRQRFERLQALDGVSFDVGRGESFGIVGRNGSGKSTLMKCLAGIYRADAGEMWLRGRMAPFIELGVGFNPDLTARDNVLINAVMLGVSPAQARERYASIVAFAELEDFQDLKLKNYSSGMQVRLAFSVMIHVDADLLLIDEVLAVGDAAFQQKCHDVLNRAKDEGRTILLVTHDMSQVQRFCDRALLLERGTVVALDDSRTIARGYTRLNFPTQDVSATVQAITQSDGGDGAAEILEAWTQDPEGNRTPSLEQGRPCALVMRVRLTKPTQEPVFGFSLIDEQHRRVLVVTTEWDDRTTGWYAPGELVNVAVSFDNWFAPGRYFLTPHVAYPGAGGRLMAVRESVTSVVVTGSRTGGGIVDVPHEFVWNTVSPDPAVA